MLGWDPCDCKWRGPSRPLPKVPTAKIMPIIHLYGGGSVVGVRMNMDDSRLIAQFQRLITEMLVEKRLGQRRSELTDELYQTWREVRQSGLNKTPEYRNVLSRADQHALWRRIGEAQQPRCCAAFLFKRKRTHRYFPRGRRVTDAATIR